MNIEELIELLKEVPSFYPVYLDRYKSNELSSITKLDVSVNNGDCTVTIGKSQLGATERQMVLGRLDSIRNRAKLLRERMENALPHAKPCGNCPEGQAEPPNRECREKCPQYQAWRNLCLVPNSLKLLMEM